MKKTQAARIVRAMGKRKRTRACVSNGAIWLFNDDSRVYIAADCTADTPTNVPLDLVPDLIANPCLVSGNTVTLGTVTRSFPSSSGTDEWVPIAHPGGGFPVSGTVSAWLAGAAGTVKDMPIFSNIFAGDGYLMATDKFRAHAIPCTDDARGAIPAALLAAFDDCKLAFDDSGAWFISGEGFDATGRVDADLPNLPAIITSALSDANRVPLGVDLLNLITSAGKLPKNTTLTIDTVGASFDAADNFMVTVPTVAPAFPVKVNPAYITSAGLTEWSISDSSRPLLALDGDRVALVMPRR